MERLYSWPWVEQQVSRAVETWNGCAAPSLPGGPRFSREEQQSREEAYDDGLREVEDQAKRARRSRAERLKAQQQLIAVFPRFAIRALGLGEDSVRLLTDGFLPVGTQFAQWSRRFDPALSMADTIQACRNAWSACGMQPLLGDSMRLTSSIVGYSLLYPYSDNYLDQAKISIAGKLDFSARFRDRLRGIDREPANDREAAVWAMVALIEHEYPRAAYSGVFDCLLAIHRAQEESLAQLKGCRLSGDEVLRISCAKGGTSVLADACLAHGYLSPDEIRFAFDWGVLLQLGDDLQDVREDVQCGSNTLFSRAVAAREPLDRLVMQLLHFGENVAVGMDRLPNGSAALKQLLRMSWRSLILMAVANSHGYFSPELLARLEPASGFRFDFLRARHKRLSGRSGLYRVLFDAFLEAGDGSNDDLPTPELWMPRGLDLASESRIAELAS